MRAMRARLAYFGLVLAGVLLGAGLGYRLRAPAIAPAPVRAASAALASAPSVVQVVRTNVVVRRQNFTWQELETADYRQFIANLRGIGCPEPTLRDIVISEINQLYAAKRATNIVTADQQWWRSEPDPHVMKQAFDQQVAMENERRALLTDLLGPGWERASIPALAGFSGINLNGPVLGQLKPETRQAVLDLNARANQRVQLYLQEQQKAGKAADSAEVARLRQQGREELAKVLSPAELEEYLLRYSASANSLRNELRGFELSPEEFKSVFHAYDALAQQTVEGGDDSAVAVKRQELEARREAALQETLGDDRYAQFKLNQDPLFREARTTVQNYGAAPETVMPLYEINQATDQERQRIRNDKTLTLEEQEEAIEAAVLAQRKSLRQVLGDEAYRRFVTAEEAKQRFLQPRSATP